MTDGHTELYNIGVGADIVGDGGPRGYRRRGSWDRLPDKYLPGRFWRGLSQDRRDAIMRALSDGSRVAPWALKWLCCGE